MHARGSGITFVGGSLLASNFKLSSITNLCLVEKPCLDRCDFKLSVMEGNNFRGASLELADFGGANLTATDFSETNLKIQILRGHLLDKQASTEPSFITQI